MGSYTDWEDDWSENVYFILLVIDTNDLTCRTDVSLYLAILHKPRSTSQQGRTVLGMRQKERKEKRKDNELEDEENALRIAFLPATRESLFRQEEGVEWKVDSTN